jgi:predicted glycoside hydrolase/deacetylase ChbG (UPF0249 family)
MTEARYLIVNADDFGQSPGVTRGIIQCFEEGIVTSASLMVRWPAAAAAAEYARAHPGLSVGLHVDLGEWACRAGEWAPVYTVVAEDDAPAVEAEISRQLEQFCTLVGREPTHLDSHQHVHRSGPARSVLLRASRRLDIPLRHYSPARYCGEFYGQTKDGLPWPEGISSRALARILAELPAGITELGCHPGLGDDVDSMYCTQRAQEVQTLCDPQFREALTNEGIELRSFRDVNSLLGRHLA